MVAESPESDVREAKRLHTLTGLRFYAALGVFLCHAVPTFLPLVSLRRLSDVGVVGVTFFFVLSGFVLAWGDRTGQAKATFYFHRFARIYPLHLATTLFAVMLATNRDIPNYWESVALSVPLLQSWFSEALRVGGNGPSWSLSCEFFFYACFPFVYPLIARMRSTQLVMVIVGALGAMMAWMVLYTFATMQLSYDVTAFSPYTFPPARLAEFIIGIALARGTRLGWRLPLPFAMTLALTVASYAAIAATSAFLSTRVAQLPNGLPAFVMSGMFLPFAAFLIFGGTSAEINGQPSMVGNRVHRWLGEVSFALYLVHLPVIELSKQLGLSNTGLAGLLAAFGVALALAGLAYHLLERPCERVLRAHWRRREAVSAAAPVG